LFQRKDYRHGLGSRNPGIAQRAIGKAAALALVWIGTERALTALFDYVDQNPTGRNVSDVCSELWKLDVPGAAHLDGILSRALSGEPAPNRILATARMARSPSKHVPLTIAELARVRIFCGEATFDYYGSQKPIAGVVDEVLKWAKR